MGQSECVMDARQGTKKASIKGRRFLYKKFKASVDLDISRFDDR
jgi:hypothetical protein